MASYTVFGGRGFIGSEFVKQLRANGHEVFVPKRNDKSVFDKDLGTVIYCAGQGDCDRKPFEVLDANTTLLSNLLKNADFELIVYISSTRVYMNGKASDESSDCIVCDEDTRKLFNLTKLISEELCRKSTKEHLIIRPSNVYGLAINSPLFLPQIIKNAILNGHVDMYVEREYTKDYVSVYDVVEMTLNLIEEKVKNKTINIASGKNVSACEIADILIQTTKCNVTWHGSDSSYEVFPKTKISEISSICEFKPRCVLNDLKSMIHEFYEKLSKEKAD